MIQELILKRNEVKMKKVFIKSIPMILKVALLIEGLLTISVTIWIPKYFNNITDGSLQFYLDVVLIGLCIFYILINTIKLANIVIDNRFEVKYLQNLRKINYCLCIVIILMLILKFMVPYNIIYLIIFSLGIILCLLIALQEVFKSAIKLQNEADTTI